MFVVSYENELREAFMAGKSAGMAIMARKPKDAHAAKFFDAIPKSYEEWIESIRDRPAIVRG
jgi:hypothetical protein